MVFVMAVLLVTGDALTEALKKATTSPDPHVRAAAARELAEIGDASAAPQLIALLQDRNDYVSIAAADALGKLGDKSVTGMFVEMLTAEHPTESNGPVFGGNSPATSNLAQLTREQRTITALQALGRLGDTNAVAVILDKGLPAPEIGIQIAAVVALGRIKDRRAVVPLVELLRQYYSALTPTDEPLIPTRIPGPLHRMKDDAAYLRAAVVWALGKIGDRGSETILARAANDENSLVRDAAKEALERLDAVTSRPRP